MVKNWINWAGNQRAEAAAVSRPASTVEVAAAVREAAGRQRTVKPVGSGHSFTAAAATDGVRLELDRLAGLVGIREKQVTVQAGMRLRVLNRILAEHGLALPNLGDIDAQTVAGALATGTHGTGAGYGCLASFVAGMTVVTGTGSVVTCDAHTQAELFEAARVGVGAVGVVTEVTLSCVDAFTLRAEERPERLADVLAGLDEQVASNDHFEFYWFPYTDRVQTKRNNRVSAADRPLPAWRAWLDDSLLSNTVFGAACRMGRAVPRLVPVLSRVEARALSPRLYTAPSYEVFCTPRRVRFVEMEYGLPRAALPEALDALRSIVDSLALRVLFPVEVRFAAGDDVWLSHSFGRDSAYIAIHQYVGMPYEPYFRAFETVAAGLGGRPHWGKMHWLGVDDLRPRYEHFGDFLAVRDRVDPDRVFANPYTDRVFGP
jgi:L-gulono-1,4-lactone dehydrogenase